MNKTHFSDQMADQSNVEQVCSSEKEEETLESHNNESAVESESEEPLENAEPNKATECSDCDTDSACGNDDIPSCGYENSEEANVGLPYQETNPPATQNVALLTYKRDALERELTRVNSGELPIAIICFFFANYRKTLRVFAIINCNTLK